MQAQLNQPESKELPVINQNFKDLNPLLFGYEQCPKGHDPYPIAHGYYLIHYVESGKGTIYIDNEAHLIEAGQLFIIKPADIVRYVADSQEPWAYTWIGFNGEYAKRLDSLPLCTTLHSKIFHRMKAYSQYGNTKELFLTSNLYELFAELLSNTTASLDYVTTTEEYIKSTYMCELTVAQLAENVCLNKDYLLRRFKEKTGKTIQQYIIDVRIKNAKELLKKGLSVFQISGMVGYRDQFNFSKIFKKKCGISPKQYAKKYAEQPSQ